MKISEKLYVGRKGLEEFGPINIVAFGDSVISGTVDGYDLFKEKYLVFIDDTNDYGELGFGNEWFLESELFASENEALASVEEKEDK